MVVHLSICKPENITDTTLRISFDVSEPRRGRADDTVCEKKTTYMPCLRRFYDIDDLCSQTGFV